MTGHPTQVTHRVADLSEHDEPLAGGGGPVADNDERLAVDVSAPRRANGVTADTSADVRGEVIVRHALNVGGDRPDAYFQLNVLRPREVAPRSTYHRGS